MFMPDVNVLIYAHRQYEEWHEPYAYWLKQVVDGPEPFALSRKDRPVLNVSVSQRGHDCRLLDEAYAREVKEAAARVVDVERAVVAGHSELVDDELRTDAVALVAADRDLAARHVTVPVSAPTA